MTWSKPQEANPQGTCPPCNTLLALLHCYLTLTWYTHFVLLESFLLVLLFHLCSMCTSLIWALAKLLGLSPVCEVFCKLKLAFFWYAVTRHLFIWCCYQASGWLQDASRIHISEHFYLKLDFFIYNWFCFTLNPFILQAKFFKIEVWQNIRKEGIDMSISSFLWCLLL